MAVAVPCKSAGGADALAKLENGDWQLLFLDRRVSDLETGELIAIIQKRFPGIQVVLLDSRCRVFRKENAETRAPREPNLLLSNPAIAGGARRMAAEASPPRKPSEAAECAPLPGMIGRSVAMQRVYRLARLVAPRSTTVLICRGQREAAKNWIARGLHLLSPRTARAFVAVNCAAIPEALLESELLAMPGGRSPGRCRRRWGAFRRRMGGRFFWTR